MKVNIYNLFIANWTTNETKLLLASYIEVEKDGSYRFNRNKFWNAVYDKVKRHSKNTLKQCKDKMDSLTKKYKEIKDATAPSGAAAGEDWEFYKVRTVHKNLISLKALKLTILSYSNF